MAEFTSDADDHPGRPDCDADRTGGPCNCRRDEVIADLKRRLEDLERWAREQGFVQLPPF